MNNVSTQPAPARGIAAALQSKDWITHDTGAGGGLDRYDTTAWPGGTPCRTNVGIGAYSAVIFSQDPWQTASYAI
jgi:hypothetical protein